MRTIKFSHRYHKMPLNLEGTYLLDVWPKHYSEMSPGFIDYDTKFEGGNYELPKGQLIVLLLYTDGQLWTTIRTATKGKQDYYKSLIGQEVKIEVKNV